MMQKQQEASIETHDELIINHLMILLVKISKALAKSDFFANAFYSIIEISKGHN